MVHVCLEGSWLPGSQNWVYLPAAALGLHPRHRCPMREEQWESADLWAFNFLIMTPSSMFPLNRSCQRGEVHNPKCISLPGAAS